MWYLTIPIPNWTGFILGFIIAFIVFFAWGLWLQHREKAKIRAREPFVQEISKRYLDDKGAKVALQKRIEKSQTD